MRILGLKVRGEESEAEFNCFDAQLRPLSSETSFDFLPRAGMQSEKPRLRLNFKSRRSLQV